MAGEANQAISGAALVELLYRDCVSALEFCLSWSSTFHKARHRLAISYETWEKDVHKAVAVMRPLFQKGRSGFCINMKTFNDNPDDTQVTLSCNSVHCRFTR